MVDGSKDIDDQGSGNFRKCLEFTKEILRSFPVSKQGVHTGIITYGRKALVDINLDTSLDQTGIESAIDAIPYSGDESYTGNALDTAMGKLFPHSGREKVAHILVVVKGSISQDEVQSSAQELRDSGVRIFCIGVGKRFDQSQLDLIASSPSGTYVITTEFNTLRNVVPTLSSRILSGKMPFPPTGRMLLRTWKLVPLVGGPNRKIFRWRSVCDDQWPNIFPSYMTELSNNYFIVYPPDLLIFKVRLSLLNRAFI